MMIDSLRNPLIHRDEMRIYREMKQEAAAIQVGLLRMGASAPNRACRFTAQDISRTLDQLIFEDLRAKQRDSEGEVVEAQVEDYLDCGVQFE